AEPSFDLRPVEHSFRRDPFAAAQTANVALALGDEEDHRFRIWLCSGAVRTQGQGQCGGSSGQNQTDGPHDYPPSARVAADRHALALAPRNPDHCGECPEAVPTRTSRDARWSVGTWGITGLVLPHFEFCRS